MPTLEPAAPAAERDPARAIRAGLRCLQLSGALFLRAHFTAPWGYESAEPHELARVFQTNGRRLILFHIFTEGRCRVALRRGGEDELERGDIAIFPSADVHRVGDPGVTGAVPIADLLPPLPWSRMPVVRHGGGGAPTSMVCGYLSCDDLPFNPVLASLPPFIKVRASGGALGRWVEASLEYALQATAGAPHRQPEPLLLRLPELLFVECLCQHAGGAPPAELGWLGALGDAVVGRVMALMHGDPARRWTLDELARRAATSRSVIDERFRALVGRAPMAYLTAWRLQLAARELRTTTASLAEIAQATGYGSEASLSRAFKRHAGVPPSEWRQRA